MDPLFKQMYQEKSPTGSVSQGLKVEQPDEFDINLGLRLPLKDQNSIQVGWCIFFSDGSWNIGCF